MTKNMHFKILKINFKNEISGKKSGKIFEAYRILKPDIRPDPDSAGYPVGS